MSDPRRNADFQSKKQSRRSVKRVSNKVLSLTVAVALSTAATSLFAPAASALDLSIATNSLAAAPSWLSGLSQTGFYQAFSLVFLSEIGDKTFFIAGLLSAKTSRLISFIGSMGALAAMTLVSVAIGQIFHAVPEGFANGIPLDDVAACLAFLFFGLKTLKEAFDLEPGESVMDEEFSEAQEAVDGSESVKQTTPWGQLASIFALVFAAEFGDRSFLSTIALSAAQNPVAVAGGAIAAHGVATGIAVSGGAVLAKYLSERVLGFIGGTLFIVFAITTAFGIF
jgi:putative Ca2+/H+ antiporter (TMEM165/GDT1 family)